MCTVTYLPTPGGFILTHNRDEAPTRSPDNISKVNISKDALLFPRDTKAQGAWVVAARSGKIACLLNGAFVKHSHQPPYRRSRGLILLDFFEWAHPRDFFHQYDLEGVEPFTFLFFERNGVLEFRWDGHQRYLKILKPDEAHFWCSATLYGPEIQARREHVFRNWLQNQSVVPTPESLFHLHSTGSIGDPENDYIMNRGDRVRTVSITQVVVGRKTAWMKYYDLLGGQQDARRLIFTQ